MGVPQAGQSTRCPPARLLRAHARQVLSAKVRLMSLQESLTQLALDAGEAAAQLIQEHDRALSEMAEANKQQLHAFFTQARRPGGRALRMRSYLLEPVCFRRPRTGRS